ncbi:hypothetical protein BKA56DRAFT_682092 [Ilyonectria sp. MPI-CAGE-AT-0026]|nr:hypothetical protein BKA56DRAFT_682092 [Ilyonectria sp. MPI-CAGE-AT-0026]
MSTTMNRKALVIRIPTYRGYKNGVHNDTGFIWDLQDERERRKLDNHLKFLKEKNLLDLSPHHPERLNRSQRIALAIFGCGLFLDNRNRANPQGSQATGIDITFIRVEMAALYDLADKIENTDDDRGQKFLAEIGREKYNPWFRELLCCVGLARESFNQGRHDEAEELADRIIKLSTKEIACAYYRHLFNKIDSYWDRVQGSIRHHTLSKLDRLQQAQVKSAVDTSHIPTAQTI